jgi:hypothetical protein
MSETLLEECLQIALVWKIRTERSTMETIGSACYPELMPTPCSGGTPLPAAVHEMPS